MQLSTIRDLLLVVMASSAYAARTGCTDGEVAVGTSQTCGIGSPRGGPSCNDVQAAIYANDCGIINRSDHEDPCAGGPGNPGVKWIHPGTVGCTAEGTPSLIQTEGGFFGNCRRVNSNCSPAPFIFQFASWYCPRL
ncbi:hypothetical protein V8C40DRAFT_278535 [Trichoderma camerunense]